MNKISIVSVASLLLVLGVVHQASATPPANTGRASTAPKRLNTQLPPNYALPSGPIAQPRSKALEFTGSADSSGKVRVGATYEGKNFKYGVGVQGPKKKDFAIDGKIEGKSWSVQGKVQPFSQPRVEGSVSKTFRFK